MAYPYPQKGAGHQRDQVLRELELSTLPTDLEEGKDLRAGDKAQKIFY